jgi:hypothetical protein
MARQLRPDLAGAPQHIPQAIMEFEHPPGKELAPPFAQE